MDDKIQYTSFILDDTDYKTTLTKKFAERIPWKEPNFNEIRSFIPGTVNQIFVKVNQSVKKGDKLLILNAMKMQNLVLSPVDGKIKTIFKEEGGIVAKNEIMIEIE